MAELVVILAVLALVVVLVGVTSRRNQARELERRNAELEPVKKLAYEDITALGTELQALDAEVSGVTLDEGAQADYQRALDAYEDAKVSGDAMTAPDDIKHVTGILDDGRYAIACVRARVMGEPLPTRRPPCFFDPRHGPSVTDVDYAPAGGASRSVPSCALDAERVGAGADPAVRQVMVGSRRVPYWEGGPAYAPYAAGYFAAGAGMSLLFGGLLIGSMGGWGFGDGWGDHGGGDSESVASRVATPAQTRVVTTAAVAETPEATSAAAIWVASGTSAAASTSEGVMASRRRAGSAGRTRGPSRPWPGRRRGRTPATSPRSGLVRRPRCPGRSLAR